MYKARVEADFAAAHFLSDYHGKCERLHGHNYRVRLWAQGSETGEGGMLVDFGVLKGALREAVGELDHRNLNDFAVFDNNPSAERIAKYLFDKTAALLGKQLPADFFAKGGKAPSAIEVYETPLNMARYEP